jgi:hypothetical protein
VKLHPIRQDQLAFEVGLRMEHQREVTPAQPLHEVGQSQCVVGVAVAEDDGLNVGGIDSAENPCSAIGVRSKRLGLRGKRLATSVLAIRTSILLSITNVIWALSTSGRVVRGPAISSSLLGSDRLSRLSEPGSEKSG